LEREKILPPPLTKPPRGGTFVQDFKLLLKNQMRVAWNKFRYRPAGPLVGMLIVLLFLGAIIVSIGSFAYDALKLMSPDIAQGALSFLFMIGLAGQVFFGITAAFAALYMSDDLELLFVAPISLKVVFAVKSLSVFGSSLVAAVMFIFVPGIFLGLVFEAGAAFYFLVLLVGFGLSLIGMAVAELINLLVMRIVPPHRSREAVGFIGALGGILIALVFQIPNILISGEDELNIGGWLAGQDQALRIMDFFPWGWGSNALADGITGNFLSGLGWCLLIILMGAALFMISFALLERGFRRGFISLSQGAGGRRKKTTRSVVQRARRPQEKFSFSNNDGFSATASPLSGMWAVAKKDLLYLKRDTREWFGYLVPLIIMAFFVGQYFMFPAESTRASLITVLFMYTVMFSGNMALQSFGREGESEWLLNSVPLGGWPVVWGKLLAAVIPTLLLMEALLVGTALAVGMSSSLTLVLALAAVLLSLGSSAVGLFYSINNSRYNSDSPQQRISPGASMLMYLVNLFFIFLLSIGLVYLFPPAELVAVLQVLPPLTFERGFISAVTYVLYILSRPILWQASLRIILGLIVTFGVWSLFFFGFLAETVRQSRKGFRVEIISGKKESRRKRFSGIKS